MIKQIKSFFKTNYLNLFLFLLITVIIFSDFLFKGTNYIIGYDIKNLFEPYYAEFKRIILNGEMPFWSHNFFLGVNLLASKSYIFLGDIFAYLIFIFKNTDILKVIFFIQPLKCFVSFVLMYILLKELNIKDKVYLFLFSLIYAFSGYVMIFLGCLQFMSFYTLAPLIFIAIERYVKNGKLLLIPIASLLLIGSTYYLFWSLCVFLVIYWPIRYFIYYKEINIKNFIIRSFVLVFFFCLGVAIYAPVLIPTVDFIKESSRVANGDEIPLLWDLDRYLDIFIKSISSPVYVSSNMPDFFKTDYYRTEQVTLFSSSICTLMIPQIFVIKDKKTRYSLITFYTIIGLLLFFQFGGSLMHGLSESSFRWTFLPVLINIIISAKLLDDGIFNKRIFIISFLVILSIICFIFIRVNNLLDYKVQLFLIILALSYLLIMGFSLSYKKYSKIIITISVISEILVGYKLTLKAKLETNGTEGYSYEALNIPDDYFEKLQEINGEEFYRVFVYYDHIDINYQKELCYNANMVLNFKSVYGYDSTRQTSINAFMNLTDEYYWWFKETDPLLLDFFSVKYTINKDKNEIVDNNWTFVEQIGDSDYYLFENNDYNPFGFTAKNLISTEEFYSNLKDMNNYDIFRNTVYIHQSLIDQFNLEEYISENSGTASLNLDYLGNNKIKGTISSDSNEIIVLTIPTDKGWHLKVDGEDYRYFMADGGFMAIPIKAGEHQIELNFRPYGFNSGLKLSLLSVSVLAACLILNRKLSLTKKII